MVITKDRSVGLTPAVAKVASGALGLVPVIQVTNLARHMKWLKQHGYWLYGADEAGQSSLYEQVLTDKSGVGDGERRQRFTITHQSSL